MTKLSLVQELKARGLIQDTTHDQLEQLLGNGFSVNLGSAKQKALTFYVGFDATANSLHVGSLIPLTLMKWLHKAGHNCIALLGGGTTKIGDPTGKDKAREMLAEDAIDTNTKAIETTIKNILGSNIVSGSETSGQLTFLNNDLWLKDLNHIEFMRDFGSHISASILLNLESMKMRLDRQQSLSLLEMSYPVLQAYDFYYLNQNHNCTLQLGGSDQWGNITLGMELIKRKSGKQAYGMTCPLLTNSENKKMGKTEKGAVWLNPQLFSPYQYWQFWRNVSDQDTIRFLKLFTFLPLEEIESLSNLKGKEMNQAKELLAHHCTTLIHGEEEALKAKEESLHLFANSQDDDSSLYDTAVTKINLEGDASINLLGIIKKLQWMTSGSQAKRAIEQGGCKVNNSTVTDPWQEFTITQDGHAFLITLGKKNKANIKIVQTS